MSNPASIAKRPPNFDNWLKNQYETAIEGVKAMGYKPRHCPDIDELAGNIDSDHERFLLDRHVPDESAQLLFVPKRVRVGLKIKTDDSFIDRHGKLQEETLGIPFSMTEQERKVISNYEFAVGINGVCWKDFVPVFALLDKKPPQLADPYKGMEARETLDPGLVYDRYDSIPESVGAFLDDEREEQNDCLVIKQMSFRQYISLRSLMLALGSKLPDFHTATIFPEGRKTHLREVPLVKDHLPLEPLIATTAINGALEFCFAPIDSMDKPVGVRRVLEIPSSPFDSDRSVKKTLAMNIIRARQG